MISDLPLLTDVFSFLCFLHANDIALRHSRFLPPGTLPRLNALLLARDEIERAPRIKAGGRRGTTERETHRIRFIHFLCESAGLVARTGAYLKPTPRVAQWLNADDSQRAEMLFRAAFPAQPNRPHDDLWRVYRLPGFNLDSPSLYFASLFDILRQAPRGERIRLTTLLKLAPLPARDDDPDTQPEPILRGILDYLAWFDAVEWHGRSMLSVTDWGVRLFSPPLPAGKAAEGVRVGADSPLPPGEGSGAACAPHVSGGVRAILDTPLLMGEGQTTPIHLNADWPALYELSEYVEPIAMKPRRRYRLDRTRVRRALQRGVTVDHMLRFLASVADASLPRPVVATVRQWADDLDRVSLRRVVLLEVRDPQRLTEITRTRAARQAIGRTLSPRALIIREDRLPSLIRHLSRRGLAPRLDSPLPYSHTLPPSNYPTTRLSDHRTSRQFDSPTLAHLYLSARICYQLSDRLPPAYRSPYSILLDLERRLDPRDRDLAAQLADEAADQIRATAVDRPPAADYRPPSAAGHLPSAVAAIQRAIDATAPLEIVYTDARRETTTRVVEPHRLEWRGDVAYLIAYCRLDRDERTFRLDRIEEMTNAK